MAATKKGDNMKKEKEPKKPREPNLHWEKNKDWTTKALEYLTNNPPFRIKLFSDSTSKAKDEGRPKVNNSEGRALQFQTLAKHIFKDNAQYKEEYENNPGRFGRSTQQHFSRLKSLYGAQVKRLKATGGGLLEGELYTNIFHMITEEWEFFPILHQFWSELPNYNPVGVSNSDPGQDHSQRAASLFQTKAMSASSLSLADAALDMEGSEAEFDAMNASDIEEDSGDKTSSGTSELGGLDNEPEEEEQENTPSRHTQLPNPFLSNHIRHPSSVPAKKERDIKVFSRSATLSRSAASASKKRTALDAFEENQASEQAAEIQRHKDLYLYRMKKLELDAQKLELEKERHVAKKRKMELDAKKAEWEVKRDEMRGKHLDMLMSFVMNGKRSDSNSFSTAFPMHANGTDGFLDTARSAHETQPWDIEGTFATQQELTEASSSTGVDGLDGSLTAELNSMHDNYM